MPNYAYKDSAGQLHITENREKIPAKYTNIIETEIECHGTFPMLNGEQIYIYSEQEAYKRDNRKSGIPFKLADEPTLYELYKALS